MTITDFFKVMLESSLDPLCIVSASGQVMQANSQMRTLLKLRARELAKHPAFCDLIKFDVCKPSCRVLEAAKIGETISYSETPAQVGPAKLRVTLKLTPLTELSVVVITVRDTSAELLMQAKYQKLKEQAHNSDDKIEELEKRLKALRAGIRY
jgi:transcriptional regulator with PAS, ATPase and Fis domain